MGVTTFSQEYSCPIAPARMFKALILDSRNLLPKLLPQVIKNIDVVEGDGGAGSIEQVNFAEAGPFKYLKHRIEVLDEEIFVCKYTMIEGGPLGDKIESIAYEVKFEESNDGGCLCKMASKYSTNGDIEIKEGESSIGIYKIAESYLQENPQAYT